MSAKIIIVDDELDMLELLELIINEKTPHQVVTTNNPLEVPRLMRQHEADLLITDLRMPAMGGIELIKKVKEYYPNLPIIVITAYGSSQSAEESIAAGAYDYITKPFRKDQILITINRALEWGAMKKELTSLQEQQKTEGAVEFRMAEKILIVDDETDMLVLLRMIIQEQTPYEPVTTPNPLEVEQLLGEKEIALVIADLRMPGLDGFQLLELIRTEHPLIPVILITAYDSPETAEEALRKGAFDYIPKPFPARSGSSRPSSRVWPCGGSNRRGEKVQDRLARRSLVFAGR